jgi:hypothetical protein
MEDKKPQTPVQYVHKYELAEYPLLKGTKQLMKDGNPCKCHRANVQMIPNMANQLVPVYEHCTTHCSRAILGVEGEQLVFVQNCEVIAQKFKIENAQAKPIKPKLEVIK